MKKCLLSLCCAGLLVGCQQEVPIFNFMQDLRSANSLQAYLQEHEVDVNARNREEHGAHYGRTPLFYIDVGNDDGTIYSFAVDMARLLVQRGANVNARDGAGFTPLLALPGIGSEYAEDRGEVQGALDMVDFYMSAGADVFARNDAGHNALDLALRPPHYSDNPLMVKKLKKLGLKSTLDRELVWCAAQSDVAGVRRLLQAGANPNACSVDGIPALIAAMDIPVASREHTVEVMKLLLAAGADPNAAETSRLHACALQYARWNPPAALRLLLQYGANAKKLPVMDYGDTCCSEYVSIMRQHGATIIREELNGASK